MNSISWLNLVFTKYKVYILCSLNGEYGICNSNNIKVYVVTPAASADAQVSVAHHSVSI